MNASDERETLAMALIGLVRVSTDKQNTQRSLIGRAGLRSGGGVTYQSRMPPRLGQERLRPCARCGGPSCRAKLCGMNISRKRVLTVVGVPVVALVVWAVAVPLAGATLTVRAGGDTQRVGPVSIVAASLVAAVVSWVLLAVLERWVVRPGRILAIVTVPVLVASVSGPLGEAVGATAKLVLVVLHLAVVAVIVVGLVLDAGRECGPTRAPGWLRHRDAGACG
jgi:Family of unknown function (DUF6069)